MSDQDNTHNGRSASANRRVIVVTILLAVGFYVGSFFLLGTAVS